MLRNHGFAIHASHRCVVAHSDRSRCVFIRASSKLTVSKFTFIAFQCAFVTSLRTVRSVREGLCCCLVQTTHANTSQHTVLSTDTAYFGTYWELRTFLVQHITFLPASLPDRKVYEQSRCRSNYSGLSDSVSNHGSLSTCPEMTRLTRIIGVKCSSIISAKTQKNE